MSMHEMGSSGALAVSSASMRAAVEDAARGLVERRSLVEAVALAAVAGEHLPVIGPPGTAKNLSQK